MKTILLCDNFFFLPRRSFRALLMEKMKHFLHLCFSGLAKPWLVSFYFRERKKKNGGKSWSLFCSSQNIIHSATSLSFTGESERWHFHVALQHHTHTYACAHARTHRLGHRHSRGGRGRNRAGCWESSLTVDPRLQHKAWWRWWRQRGGGGGWGGGAWAQNSPCSTAVWAWPWLRCVGEGECRGVDDAVVAHQSDGNLDGLPDPAPSLTERRDIRNHAENALAAPTHTHTIKTCTILNSHKTFTFKPPTHREARSEMAVFTIHSHYTRYNSVRLAHLYMVSASTSPNHTLRFAVKFCPVSSSMATSPPPFSYHTHTRARTHTLNSKISHAMQYILILHALKQNKWRWFISSLTHL